MTPEPPTHRCVICAKANPADGWTTCRGCLNRLDDDLLALVVLTREAANHVVRGATGQTSGGGKPGSKPPCDLGALDDSLGLSVLELCEGWERLCREFYGLAPYGPISLLRVRKAE